MQYLSRKFGTCYRGATNPTKGQLLPAHYTNICYINTNTGIRFIDKVGDGSWTALSGINKTPKPILNGPSSGTEGTVANIVITNYDKSFTYTVNISGGSYIISTDTISWTLPNVNTDTNYTISVTAEDTTNGKPVSSAGTLIVKVIALPVTPSPVITISQSVNENTAVNGSFTSDTNSITTITAVSGTISNVDQSAKTFVYTAPDITNGKNSSDIIRAFSNKSGYKQSKTVSTDITVVYVPITGDGVISNANYSANKSYNNNFLL